MKYPDDFINKIIQGDSLEVMKEIPDNSIDTIITDPPYGLEFMGKEWDSPKAMAGQIAHNEDMRGAFAYGGTHTRGYTAVDLCLYQEWTKQWAKEALRIAKPGATLLCFGGCYDDKTEVLTEEGWKFFKNISKEDRVATLNPETEEIEYQNPIELVEYDNYNELIYFKTNKVDLMVTPNHKLFVKYMGGYKNAKWKLIRADEVKSAIKMKKNGIWKGKEEEFFVLPSTKQSNGHYIKKIPEKKIPMDIWLKFFGLYLAEGSATIVQLKNGKSYKTQLCHFNNNNLDEIEKELSKYFSICRYKESGKFVINNKQLTEYLKQFGCAWQKFIPKEIKQLSSRQLKILLDWYMKGDSDGRRIYTSSKKLVDDIQEIALKIGISADYTIRKNKKKGYIGNREIHCKHTQYIISINKTQNEPEVYQKRKKIKVKEIVPYRGKVYCVEVPKYHTLYVRRNGKAVWCGNTRTWHRLACGLEDAGWIIKDTLMWLYSQGFPKATDISKQLDKKANAKRNVIGKQILKGNAGVSIKEKGGTYIAGASLTGVKEIDITAPATPEAKLWNGWKSHGLKPAWEPIIMAMKPNEGSYAENALKWGVAGLNIDGGRIGVEQIQAHHAPKGTFAGGEPDRGSDTNYYTNQGRFPANLLLDEEAAEMLDEQSGISKSTGGRIGNKGSMLNMCGNDYQKGDPGFGDSGGASRFFYVAKASRSERDMGLDDFPERREGFLKDKIRADGTYKEAITKNIHPTVKPLKLMEYLCILTKTPTGGIVLDPFAGSGTTCMAAKKVGRDYIGIETEPEYVAIARARIKAIPKPLI